MFLALARVLFFSLAFPRFTLPCREPERDTKHHLLRRNAPDVVNFENPWLETKDSAHLLLKSN